MLPITALYAGLLGLLCLVLGIRSGLLRQKTGVSLGSGDSQDQLVAFRRHGNFSEWVPMALILIAVLELNNVSGTALHLLGASLFVARVAHPLGLSAEKMAVPARSVGAAGTALVVLISGVWAIVTFL